MLLHCCLSLTTITKPTAKPMIRILILEDEAPALALLRQELEALTEFETEVIATFQSVSEAVEWFRNGGRPDLVLCDIELNDGHSFHIFSQVSVQAPVIFITGFDQFVMQSLEYNGINYLLKPVSGEELRRALQKFETMRSHFSDGASESLGRLLEMPARRRRTRIIVQRGLEQVALNLSDIVFFYTENKVVFVLDRRGGKYIYDGPLQQLELELDPLQFFRANRQYLINIDHILSFRTVEKSKLKVQMDVPDKTTPIIVSQETASRFRRWIQAS
jgi:DNA-binding LytR/AlgR family response regulator